MHRPPPPLQPKLDEAQRQYVAQAWGALLDLLHQDARQSVAAPLPAALAGDKVQRQAIKDKWSAVNRVLTEAQAQQVGSPTLPCPPATCAGVLTEICVEWPGSSPQPRTERLTECPALAAAVPLTLTQGWCVPDTDLRDHLRDQLAEELMKPYQAFYAKYQHSNYTGRASSLLLFCPSTLAHPPLSPTLCVCSPRRESQQVRALFPCRPAGATGRPV